MKAILFVLCVLSFQVGWTQLNYEPGTVTLRNGEVLEGNVANMRLGFRDELLPRIRIKEPGRLRARKLNPRQITEYTMGDRRFLSLRVQRNNAIFQESYTVNAGNEYMIFELHRTGHLNILLAYFLDDDMWIQSAPYFMKEGDDLIVRATQGIFGLKRKLLADYFKDCPQLVEFIQEKEITTPKEVAIYYNEWKENQLNPQ